MKHIHNISIVRQHFHCVMVTFTQYHGITFSLVIRYNHTIKILLNSWDFVTEVTFRHIVVFLKPVVTPWKHSLLSVPIQRPYSFSLKIIFADIVNLAFIGQITFSQNFENNWSKNVNFRKSIQSYADKLKLIPATVS